MSIRNCGELTPGDDWSVCDNDKTDDKLPPFPEDWDQKNRDHTVIQLNSSQFGFSFPFKIIRFKCLWLDFRLKRHINYLSQLKMRAIGISFKKILSKRVANTKKPYDISIT